MKIIILGGDGFCGWPTSLHLSAAGHEVVIVDSLVRRKIDVDLEVQSLTPIQPISARIQAWREISGKEIRFLNMDLADQYHRLLSLLIEFKPDVVVHFGEQRSAPFSMKSSSRKRYSINNNVATTHNLMAAIVESGIDIHVVHLGTMGVYGYDSIGMAIPEGYLKVRIGSGSGVEVEKDILYPANPGSIYHLSKTMDQLIFSFYNRNDSLRITDLHQGIVWGTVTAETKLDERLINRFDYDGDYGTVLNRFLMQAAIGYPLTVHGAGGQTRAFIHIRDSVRCIQLAIENPPLKGDRVQIFNQMTETHRVIDLAKLVAESSGAQIQFVPNPRLEQDSNDLVVEGEGLRNLGLTPTLLEEGLLQEVKEVATKYRERCDINKIPCGSFWNEARAQAADR